MVHLLVNLSKFFPTKFVIFFSQAKQKKLGKIWRIVFGFSSANLTNFVVVVGFFFF
jgi:hypothetical protein